jgi:signal peptidase I
MSVKDVNRVARAASRWGGRLVLLMCLGLLGVGAAQVVSGNYQVHPVLTGSMRPGFSLGSVVVVKKVPASSLQVRDVLLFHKPTNPDEYVVHRIVKVTDRDGAKVIETKGDDNPIKDPWQFTLHGRTAYRAQFTVPYVGYAALWLHRPATRRYALFGAAALLLAAGFSMLFKADPDDGAEDPADAESAAAAAAVAGSPGRHKYAR